MRITGVGGDQSVDVGALPAYERLESRLRSHAHGFGYTVGVFDWAIWIVMRAAAAMEPAWAS
jgi:N-glycosylase/DNA lyase